MHSWAKKAFLPAELSLVSGGQWECHGGARLRAPGNVFWYSPWWLPIWQDSRWQKSASLKRWSPYWGRGTLYIQHPPYPPLQEALCYSLSSVPAPCSPLDLPLTFLAFCRNKAHTWEVWEGWWIERAEFSVCFKNKTQMKTPQTLVEILILHFYPCFQALVTLHWTGS